MSLAASIVYSWWNAAAHWLIGAAAAVFWLFVGKWLLCSLAKWFCWLVLLIFQFAIPAVLALLEQVPGMPTLIVGPIVQSWRIVDYLFPLNENVAFIGVCVVLIGGFRLFRLVKQFIPTWSN